MVDGHPLVRLESLKSVLNSREQDRRATWKVGSGDAALDKLHDAIASHLPRRPSGVASFQL